VRAGHPWGPGRVTVDFRPCACPGGKPSTGHTIVACRAEGYGSAWYRPAHDPGRDTTLTRRLRGGAADAHRPVNHKPRVGRPRAPGSFSAICGRCATTAWLSSTWWTRLPRALPSRIPRRHWRGTPERTRGERGRRRGQRPRQLSRSRRAAAAHPDRRPGHPSSGQSFAYSPSLLRLRA
jgi:hypothetical protein